MNGELEKFNPNDLPDRQALLRNDREWWNTFFGPAWRAYQRKDYVLLKRIVAKYRETINKHRLSHGGRA